MNNIISHMMVHGKRVGITAETIRKTWLWFADNNQGCIDEVLNGDVFINPDFKDEYLADKATHKQSNLEAAKDLDIPSGTSLWFWQRAYYIQEGGKRPNFRLKCDRSHFTKHKIICNIYINKVQ